MQALRKAAECEKLVLDNGMTVLVKPMPGYRDVHVVCGTRFGSVDREFELDGRRCRLPVAFCFHHRWTAAGRRKRTTAVRHRKRTDSDHQRPDANPCAARQIPFPFNLLHNSPPPFSERIYSIPVIFYYQYITTLEYIKRQKNYF